MNGHDVSRRLSSPSSTGPAWLAVCAIEVDELMLAHLDLRYIEGRRNKCSMKRNEDEGQGKDMKEVQQIKLGWYW